MEGLLNFISIYIGLIIFWLIVNVIFYALTIVTKKALFFIPFFINTIFNWALQIYIVGYFLYLLWQTIIAKEWLILVLTFVFASFLIGFWQMIISFLMFPINGITIFLSQRAAEKVERNDNEEFDYEYISPEGKIIGKFQSDDKANKLLARWFLVSYGVTFLHQFTKSGGSGGLGLIWLLILPMVVVALASLIIAIFVGIWKLIKTKSFFGNNKISFITTCLKIEAIIYVISVITNLLLL